MTTIHQRAGRLRRRTLRLLQALLASLALTVVITPPGAATPVREASVLLAKRPGGSPPPVSRFCARAAVSQVASCERAARYVRSFAPSRPRAAVAVIVRDLLRVTNRILR